MLPQRRTPQSAHISPVHAYQAASRHTTRVSNSAATHTTRRSTTCARKPRWARMPYDYRGTCGTHDTPMLPANKPRATEPSRSMSVAVRTRSITRMSTPLPKTSAGTSDYHTIHSLWKCLHHRSPCTQSCTQLLACIFPLHEGQPTLLHNNTTNQAGRHTATRHTTTLQKFPALGLQYHVLAAHILLLKLELIWHPQEFPVP